MTNEKKVMLDAYYYNFEPTGVKEIDEILSAVAWAGEAFHHTSQWTEECESYGPSATEGNGVTPVDWIQNAANRAASKFKEK